MSSVKAKLKVILQADEVVVAESDDPGLWQQVLLFVNGAGSASLKPPTTAGEVSAPGAQASASNSSDAVSRLSQLLGVARDVVEGACSPTAETPFLHLDMHCWEEMKKQTPGRGPGSIAPISLAATLLALWFRAAGDMGNATQAQAQKVLGTIGLRDANAARSLASAPWLQLRSGGTVIVNPALMSKAISVARAFCTQQWGTEK